MGYTQPGCKIISGNVYFDGVDLTKISETEKRKMWGTKISYVAQSAAASFNPAHRLMGQTISAASRAKLNSEEALKKDASVFDCLVVGMPDEKFGQKIVAVVSTVDNQQINEAELIENTRKSIAGYKLPKTILFTDEVQRAPNGKANYKWAKTFAEEQLT